MFRKESAKTTLICNILVQMLLKQFLYNDLKTFESFKIDWQVQENWGSTMWPHDER